LEDYMTIDYHFTVYGDGIKLGILTNDAAAMEAFKRDHLDWVAFPAELRFPPKRSGISPAMAPAAAPAASNCTSQTVPNGDTRNQPPRYLPPSEFERATARPMTPAEIAAASSVAEVLAARRAELEAIQTPATTPRRASAGTCR
jgi:hypothetical protein